MGKQKTGVDFKSYNIPKSLKIGSVLYDVVFPYLFNEDSAYTGLHEHDDLRIKLGIMSPCHQSEYLPKQKIYENFLHETIHGVDSIFCDTALTESEVEALTMAWYSILLENDLNIKKNINTMPEEVKIFGLYYSLQFTDFKDVEEQCLCSASSCNITMANSVKKLDPQLQKMLLVYMLNCVIDRVFEMRFTDEKNEHLVRVFRCFSSGLYQVLYENDLENMFKCLRRQKK